VDPPQVAPPASGFRLLRYFTLASLAAFVLVAAPLMYLGKIGDDYFHQALQEQSAFFAQVQDDFARQQNETALRDLQTILEAGSINLTQLFANALWEKNFAPLVAKAQRFPADHCRAIADIKDAAGKSVQADEKTACYARIGANILALPEFRPIDASVSDAMKKSTVFKIKVYDLRGITVYSSDHSQIGEDKFGNAGWQSALAGKPASGLTHRDKFSAFEGVVENRDLIEIYIPATASGSDAIVGVFEIYSDVTPFLQQIKRTSTEIQNASAENQVQLERAVAASEARADNYWNLQFVVVLGLMALLYGALFLIVRNGQRIIDTEKAERMRAEAALGESETRFRSLTALSSDWYWEQDDQYRFIDASSGLRERTGNDEHLGKTRWELPAVGVSEERWAAHRADLEAHRPFRSFEYALRARNGDLIHMSVSGMPTFDVRGMFKGYRGAGTDITGRKLAEADLRIAATAFEAQEGMVVTDADSMILRVNRAFTEITGYAADEAVGQTPRLLRSGRHDAAFYQAMWESLRDCGTWKGEIWNRRKSGEVYPEWLTITAVKDGEETITHYVATLTDITRRKAAEDEIRHLAFYDPLTQLPNRRLLMDRLHQALAGSERTRHRGALLFIDLDQFKTLNDTLGHDKGDLLLQQVAQRLVACVREADTVARLGGDEFVVMLEDLSESAEEALAQTRTIAEKILATFSQPHLLAGYQHQSTGSIGVTPFYGHEQTATVLLKQADIAMYRAKAAGRNGVRFFEPGMQTEVAAAAPAGEPR
jgi:diguanylate cyclase (GGDEF)-like protein/PAS domain S-box-containing protein